MADVYSIRKDFFEKGLNISEISRESKLDRKTVRKYLEKEDWNINTQSTFLRTLENICPILTPFKGMIRQWLEEDKHARRKQRHTSKRVYTRLKEYCNGEAPCCYKTVSTYVRFLKKELYQAREAMIPLEHIPGEAQADFGKAEFYENGRKYYGYYLNLSLPYSNAGYLQLFKGENQECLLQGLRNIFEHMGAVPVKIWFDNASTMVKNIVQGPHRELTDGFYPFVNQYGFEPCFCNPNSGHEKGNVENKVGYHRRNILVPVPRFAELQSYNQKLLGICDEDMAREHYMKDATHLELYGEDLKRMRPLPAVPLNCSRIDTFKTNAFGKFTVESVHTYSTSPNYALKNIMVEFTAYEVIPLDDSGRGIVRHDRLYGKVKQEAMDWIPYLTILSRHPRAIKYSGIYAMLPDPLKDYMENLDNRGRGQVLDVLARMTEKSGFEDAVHAVTEALVFDARDAESLLAIYQKVATGLDIPPPLATLPASLPVLSPFAFDAAEYDKAFLKGGDLLDQ